MKKTATVFYFSFLIFLVTVFLQIAYYSVLFPDKINSSQEKSLDVSAHFGVTAKTDPDSAQASTTSKIKKTDVQLLLYGVIPIKNVEIRSARAPELIPSGEPFGLKMLTDGVIVTDFGTVESENGSFSPAQKAGVEIGDIIVYANDVKINSSNDLLTAIERSPEKVNLTLIREEATVEIEVKTEKALKDGAYRLGMWTRDSCAGIGTITYYDAENCTFGGLGHAVCDVSTGQVLPISSGCIVPVCVNDVNKSVNGYPGELCGSFMSQKRIGSIEKNCGSGIFGFIDSIPDKRNAIPMAFKSEVEIGEAKILCTLDGFSPKEYEIIIEKVNVSADSSEHNMVIKITDPEILSRTGGIVQGMSGSPIIQNGKLVGAVTHVFVNDVTKGYGIFAENMYNESTELSQTVENAA